jgi:hypothetical protein
VVSGEMGCHLSAKVKTCSCGRLDWQSLLTSGSWNLPPSPPLSSSVIFGVSSLGLPFGYQQRSKEWHIVLCWKLSVLINHVFGLLRHVEKTWKPTGRHQAKNGTKAMVWQRELELSLSLCAELAKSLWLCWLFLEMVLELLVQECIHLTKRNLRNNGTTFTSLDFKSQALGFEEEGIPVKRFPWRHFVPILHLMLLSLDSGPVCCLWEISLIFKRMAKRILYN